MIPRITNIEQSELFAWKRIETRDLADGYLQEVKTLKARHHEHLIPLVACYETPAGQSYQSQDPALHLIFPWAAMDMSNWMRPNDARPPEHLRGPEEPRRRKEYLYETILSLISALSYLHREIDGTFTSHHDLKPQNIVLFGEQWKICDFGMTHLRSLEEGSQTERKLGSYAYHPPEYEDKNVRKHGRSFDIWSMGCITMELAVLIAYGWEEEKLSAFEAERAKNLNRPCARDRNDVSFHNNMSIVDRWMETLAREEGSRNFTYLMDTAAKMLSMDRDARPYSWEVEIYLYEQFHPDQPGNERRAKMRGLIQAPMQNYRHNPLLRAMAESNSDLVQCLRENGWTLDSSSSAGRPITHSENYSSDVLNSFENFKLSSTQTAELFERTCKVRGYDSNHIADERRHLLAQRFTAKVSPSQRTFWEVKHILEPRHPLDPMKIFTEEIDVNHGDGDQNTALFWASWGRDATMVDVLLRYGAHLDPINKLSETPLMVASKLGHADVVERLLMETVEINYRDNHRRTALSYAAQFGRTEVVRHLLENGADVQIAGEWGRTPLSVAAQWGNKKIVRLLMDHLADPTSKDNKGISPLSHAMAEYRHRKWKGEAEDHLREYQDIIELLKGKDRVNEAVVREVLRQRNIEDPRP